MAGGLRRIEQMYCYVMFDPIDNTEGVPAYLGPDGLPIPMVGADMKRAEALRPMALAMSIELDVKITLCRFEVRTELEVFEP